MMYYTLNHQSPAQPLSYETFLSLCGADGAGTGGAGSTTVEQVAATISDLTRAHDEQSAAAAAERRQLAEQASAASATPAERAAAASAAQGVAERQSAADNMFRESKRKAKEQLPSLYPNAVPGSASGKTAGFRPSGYVFIDYDGVCADALERSMALLCAEERVRRHGIMLVGLSPSARGFRVIARVSAETYRRLYHSGAAMDCRELMETAGEITDELGWHPTRVTANNTYYEEGAVDHSVFSYTRKMYLAPAAYVRYGIREGTVKAMLDDDGSALRAVIDDELHLTYGQEKVDMSYKREWVNRRSIALTGKPLHAAPHKRSVISQDKTLDTAGSNPYNAIPPAQELLGVPARDFAYVYFTNQCAGSAVPDVGTRHTELVLYANIVAPCYEGDYDLTRAAMPDFFIGQSNDEIDDIVRSACTKFGQNNISRKAQYIARITRNERVIAQQPPLPAALPEWLATIGQKYTECETNMRMFIMRVFTVLCARTTDWTLEGRMSNDTLIPALHTLTITPTSFGKGNVDKLIAKCVQDKTAEALEAVRAIEENHQERSASGDGKKPKKLLQYVPIMNNVTEAAAMQNFAAANKLRKRVYMPETDLTKNTMTVQKRAWLSEMIKKSSDTNSDTYQLRASDAGSTVACQPCANVDLLGVENNVRWFLEPSVRAGNDGLIGRFLYCYLVKSYNPLKAQIPVLHSDPDDKTIIDIVSRVDKPWTGPVPADIRRLIDEIQEEQIGVLLNRASAAYYDFFQRQLDMAYIVACLCYRLSGEFGDKEEALVRFVFNESVFSFSQFLEADINAQLPQPAAARPSHRADIRRLARGVNYTVDDIAQFLGIERAKAVKLVARWVREKKIVQCGNYEYTLNI